MSYTEEDVLNAFQAVRAIDAEHGRDPLAYLERIGIPRTAVDLAFKLGDETWKVTREHLRIADDHPLAEAMRDEVRQGVAAGVLRGLFMGEALRRERADDLHPPLPEGDLGALLDFGSIAAEHNGIIVLRKVGEPDMWEPLMLLPKDHMDQDPDGLSLHFIASEGTEVAGPFLTTRAAVARLAENVQLKSDGNDDEEGAPDD